MRIHRNYFDRGECYEEIHSVDHFPTKVVNGKEHLNFLIKHLIYLASRFQLHQKLSKAFRLMVFSYYLYYYRHDLLLSWTFHLQVHLGRAALSFIDFSRQTKLVSFLNDIIITIMNNFIKKLT